MESLASLITETRNAESEHIDELSTLEMLTVINREDATVAAAVASQIPVIAAAVDEIAERFAQGGRLFYIGAGTSGRLGVLDASECPLRRSPPRARRHCAATRRRRRSAPGPARVVRKT